MLDENQTKNAVSGTPYVKNCRILKLIYNVRNYISGPIKFKEFYSDNPLNCGVYVNYLKCGYNFTSVTLLITLIKR